MTTPGILIPLDGSEHSKFACELAYKLAALVPGAEIMHLLHCFGTIPNLIGGGSREKLIERDEAEAEELFAPYKERFAKLGNPCHTYVRYGDAGEIIASLAEELGCELIVMGCRGQSGLSGLVLGSVSNHVLQYTKVPVMLARTSSS